MKRFFLITGLVLAVLAVGYLLGPSAGFDEPAGTRIPIDWTTGKPDLPTLERRIASSERKAHLRPDNEARIVWADSSRKAKTPYSIVYLPGFSASWAEGDPVHKRLAAHFGCNLYLARTAEHGVDSPDPMKNITPAAYTRSAEQALAVGRALGEKVIVMGTSAGGMLTLYLAAHHPDIAGLILYSPCVAVANPALRLVTKPWGQQILDRVFPEGHVANTHYSGERARYWLPAYSSRALITLQTMVERYMIPTEFARVKQPVFMGYYYKDAAHQDMVVSVPAMLDMFDQLGTPERLKEKKAFPKAGAHVIASHFTSGDLEGVYKTTEQFMTNTLRLPAAPAETVAVVPQVKK